MLFLVTECAGAEKVGVQKVEEVDRAVEEGKAERNKTAVEEVEADNPTGADTCRGGPTSVEIQSGWSEIRARAKLDACESEPLLRTCACSPARASAQ